MFEILNFLISLPFLGCFRLERSTSVHFKAVTHATQEYTIHLSHFAYRAICNGIFDSDFHPTSHMIHDRKTTRILRFLTHKAPSKSSCLMFGNCPTRTFSAQIRGYLNTSSGKVRFSWYLNCYVRAIRTTCGLCQPRLCAADHASLRYIRVHTHLRLHPGKSPTLGRQQA